MDKGEPPSWLDPIDILGYLVPGSALILGWIAISQGGLAVEKLPGAQLGTLGIILVMAFAVGQCLWAVTRNILYPLGITPQSHFLYRLGPTAELPWWGPFLRRPLSPRQAKLFKNKIESVFGIELDESSLLFSREDHPIFDELLQWIGPRADLSRPERTMRLYRMSTNLTLAALILAAYSGLRGPVPQHSFFWLVPSALVVASCLLAIQIQACAKQTALQYALAFICESDS